MAICLPEYLSKMLSACNRTGFHIRIEAVILSWLQVHPFESILCGIQNGWLELLAELL